MARGWESKSVEGQQESAASRAESLSGAGQKREQRTRDQERRGFELSRTRVMRELAAATHPRHRAVLEAALKHLEEKIADLR